MYERSSPLTSVNECRQELFTKKICTLENIPPSEDALMQHLKRAMLQAFIWVSSLLRQLPEIDFSECGWVFDENGVHPLWKTLEEAAKACTVLRKCGCKKRCNPKTCSCKKNHHVKCTQLCACYDNTTRLFGSVYFDENMIYMSRNYFSTYICLRICLHLCGLYTCTIINCIWHIFSKDPTSYYPDFSSIIRRAIILHFYVTSLGT